ncbi:unnamed protein product [Auanema sp. JU1783]|nr:unnamed protein product [Auanema sp. JU1783]
MPHREDDIERTKSLMQSILSDVIEKSESYKFIRMADDLHDVAQYLNDMRICFIAITITGYVLLIIYGFVLCMRRNRQNQPRRRNWDYPLETTRDFNNTAQTNTDELTSVRGDGNIGYGRRSHRLTKNSLERRSVLHASRTDEPSTDETDGRAGRSSSTKGRGLAGSEAPDSSHHNGSAGR